MFAVSGFSCITRNVSGLIAHCVPSCTSGALAWTGSWDLATCTWPKSRSRWTCYLPAWCPCRVATSTLPACLQPVTCSHGAGAPGAGWGARQTRYVCCWQTRSTHDARRSHLPVVPRLCAQESKADASPGQVLVVNTATGEPRKVAKGAYLAPPLPWVQQGEAASPSRACAAVLQCTAAWTSPSSRLASTIRRGERAAAC